MTRQFDLRPVTVSRDGEVISNARVALRDGIVRIAHVNAEGAPVLHSELPFVGMKSRTRKAWTLQVAGEDGQTITYAVRSTGGCGCGGSKKQAMYPTFDLWSL